MVDYYEVEYPSLDIRAGVRAVLREIGIDGGWM
jgi:hypothetical protein